VKKAYKRHDARKYETRRSSRWIDYRGERKGRLLCLEWVGRWRNGAYWKCQCDCGKQTITRWKGSDGQSCGCLNAEKLKDRNRFLVLHVDGTWRHNLGQQVKLPDGRVFPSKMALGRYIGISQRAIFERIKNWPPERWLEPPHPRGLGEKKHRRRWMRIKARERKTRKPQPWSAANLGDHAKKEHEREGPA